MILRTAALAWALAAAAPTLADEAFVTNQGDDTVGVLDLASGNTIATISVPGKPAGIAISPDGSRAYVTSPDAKTLSVIDTAARRVLRTVTLQGGPLGVAADARGTVYVADWFGSSIVLVDPERGVVSGSIAVGRSPSGLAIAPDGHTMVVADREDDRLSIVDLDRAAVVATVAVGAHPFGVAVAPDGRTAYAACVESDDVAVVDIPGRRLVARIPAGRRPYVVALAKRRGFVTDQIADAVSVFDLDTLKPVGRVAVQGHPEGIEASADGSRVYVANWFDDTLSVIDTESLRVVAQWPTGSGPRAFGTFLRRTD